MAARPKGKDTKNNQYRLRMTDEELEKLEYCSKLTGLTKADVIRKGIDKVYDEVVLKEK
jgi:predicted DNA-binding protein